MKGRMQKTMAQANDCPQRDRSETEWYEGVQTFMWIHEDNIAEVPFDKEHVLEQILNPENLSHAYKCVMQNKGCGGIDKMSCEQLLSWLLANREELISSLLDGLYRPNPVKRVEIPKDNGKKRLLGIPTVVDRLVQQAINQALMPHYERKFSRSSFGFRPRKASITRFIESKLHLKVNNEKTVVSYVRGVKYLGYSFYVMKGKCKLMVHPKSKQKMKSRLKTLTSRSNGWGYAKRKQKLKEYIRGWIGYYHLAEMRRLLLETDEWLRRRIRMCIWKTWKKVKTRVTNLIRCGIPQNQAYQWGNTRKSYWRTAGSFILSRAITNENLRRAGYVTLMGEYLEWHPK